jgi:neurofibromin 1
MVAMPPGTGYEVDPTKAKGQDIIHNQKNVEYVASTFLRLISSSLPALPGLLNFFLLLKYVRLIVFRMFREICAHIAKVV